MKRFLDLVVSLLALIIFMPVIIVIAFVLLCINRGTPFFYQSRPGLHSSIFKLIKFKTMTDKTDAHGNLLPDNLRITPFGRFLRASSLDELPQLFNVIKGDMSLVGPRPLLPKYLPLYSQRQARRHEVRPGITGWSQVNGRNSLSWEQKFEMDVWYVENISFLLDLKILWLTIVKVLKREGISQQGQATMEAFKGSNHKNEQ